MLGTVKGRTRSARAASGFFIRPRPGSSTGTTVSSAKMRVEASRSRAAAPRPAGSRPRIGYPQEVGHEEQIRPYTNALWKRAAMTNNDYHKDRIAPGNADDELWLCPGHLRRITQATDFSHLDLRFENAQQGKDFHDLTSGRRRLRPGEKRSSFQTTTTSLVRRWSNQAMQLGAVPATTGGLLLEQPRAARATGRHARTKVGCYKISRHTPNYGRHMLADDRSFS